MPCLWSCISANIAARLTRGEALRMADVFISYKSDDRVFAQTLAQRLGEQGFTIWHDQGMGADSEYHKQIAVELAAAKVVIALWSARSHDSRWVYSEADEADKANKLINASIDGQIPPKPFDRLHCRDLSGWQGAPSDDRYKSLLDDVRRVISRQDGGPAAERSLPQDSAAARAWLLIQDETDPERYHQFLAQHGASPQAVTARRHLDDIVRWQALTGPPSREKLTKIDQFILSGPFSALGEGAKQLRRATLDAVVGQESHHASERIRQFAKDLQRFNWDQRERFEETLAAKALDRAKHNADRCKQELDKAQKEFDDVKDARLVEFKFSGLPPNLEVESFLVWAGRWLMWSLVLGLIFVLPAVFTVLVQGRLGPDAFATQFGYAMAFGFFVAIFATISVDHRALYYDSRLERAEAAQGAATSAEAAHNSAQAAADEAWKPFQRAIDAFELKRPGA